MTNYFVYLLFLSIILTSNSTPLHFEESEKYKISEYEMDTGYTQYEKLSGIASMEMTHNSYDGFGQCLACKGMIFTIQEALKYNVNKDRIIRYFSDLCKILKVEDRDVCDSISKLFEEEAFFVLGQSKLHPSEVCSILMPGCGSFTPPKWNITLPDVPKPPLVPFFPPAPNVKVLRILHLSDIHLDLMYSPGSEVLCSKPLCCRTADAIVKQPAMKWGSRGKCDLPLVTLQNLFQHLSRNESFDIIYLTGDLPPHNVWNQSRIDQLTILKLITDMLIKYFPKTLILPSLGNHESSPVDSFPPPFITGNDSISWLYNALAKNWTHFVGNASSMTIKKGGYYSILVRPGLRVVSLNMNYCNNLNWWLYINMTDPADELSWLIDILQQSENKQEKVHIIGHIPPSQCIKWWGWHYYRIVNRYEGTIAAQFFGHTHNDEFQIFYDDKLFIRPVSVAYLGPGVTTYSDFDPSYRIYEVDARGVNSSWSVLDHATYTLNLTEANLFDKPQWRKEYSAKSAYNMDNLQPDDWNNLISEFETNHTLFQKFYMHYMRPATKKCDKRCKKHLLCSLRTARIDDKNLCKHVKNFKLYQLMEFKNRQC